MVEIYTVCGRSKTYTRTLDRLSFVIISVGTAVVVPLYIIGICNAVNGHKIGKMHLNIACVVHDAVAVFVFKSNLLSFGIFNLYCTSVENSFKQFSDRVGNLSVDFTGFCVDILKSRTGHGASESNRKRGYKPQNPFRFLHIILSVSAILHKLYHKTVDKSI